jgi:hypothetical protein
MLMVMIGLDGEGVSRGVRWEMRGGKCEVGNARWEVRGGRCEVRSARSEVRI